MELIFYAISVQLVTGSLILIPKENPVFDKVNTLYLKINFWSTQTHV